MTRAAPLHAGLLVGGSIAVVGMVGMVGMVSMHFARYGWPRRQAVATGG